MVRFPRRSNALERFGLKFTSGGSHISRTMMLCELELVLQNVPAGADPTTYRESILNQNVLGKATESTRQKSLRHLKELYALDESTPIFLSLRKLHSIDAGSLPLLALQVAWARDPLLRATTPAVSNASVGDIVETSALSTEVANAFPGQYSELNTNKIARNAASSWTQSGHLAGRAKKIRQLLTPSPVAVTMALFLGQLSGYFGAEVFRNPWCELLDMDAARARIMAQEAHRAGLVNLRAIGDVVELSFTMFGPSEGF